MQLPDGLVGGGPVDLYGTLEVFDTDTNAWSKLAPMPTPRNHHNRSDLAETHIFILIA
jgi:hypothetical protein